MKRSSESSNIILLFKFGLLLFKSNSFDIICLYNSGFLLGSFIEFIIIPIT